MIMMKRRTTYLLNRDLLEVGQPGRRSPLALHGLGKVGPVLGAEIGNVKNPLSIALASGSAALTSSPWLRRAGLRWSGL